MNLLPMIYNEEFFDGHYIYALNYCRNNYNQRSCKNYYCSIKNKPGYHTCPFGLVSYVDEEKMLIYTGFRHKELYKKNLSKTILSVENKYNPILSSNQIKDLINASNDIIAEKRVIADKELTVDSISHEVKKLNSQIKEISDNILQNQVLEEKSKSNDSCNMFEREIRTIYIAASIIDSRFSISNYEKKPEMLTTGILFDCNVYKKFHKFQQIFKGLKRNQKTEIIITGESYATFKAYPTFEYIPLLIIENALKYSNKYYENPIEIIINDDKEGTLLVKVKSFSPYCSSEELSKIFNKGFRGKNAQKICREGNGVGLYFVKKLCEIHKIEIWAESDSKNIVNVNEVPYAHFTITLKFPDVKY